MKENKHKFLIFLLLFVSTASNLFSQTTDTASKVSSLPIPVNTVLFYIAVTLLIIILILAYTVNAAVDFYKYKEKEKKNTTIKNVSIFIGLLLVSHIAMAQTPATTSAAAATPSAWYGNLFFYSFIVVILIEIAIILFFVKTLRYLTGIDTYKKEENAKPKQSLWQRFNKFQSLEDEEHIDIGHSYDGIRELDNTTPPWFVVGFVASIIFAIVYFYRAEISHSAPSQLEEYATEMREAKILQDSLLKKEGNAVDENTVTLLDATGIAAGKKIFVANCAACHGELGQGGVGPNLTDDYWLHGGSIHNVFKSIKYGWADKGMKSWKDDFSPTQIAELASFVKSLKGTNPPNAKEKQGELYVEDAGATASAPKADSTTK